MLAGRVGLSPVMVGRAAELDRLTRLLADRPATGPTVALVAGEAGVGKTRLVRELVERAPAGVPVLAAGADPGALGRRFELVVDALQHASAGDATVSALADRDRPLDERLTDALAAVRKLTAGGPALIVFEDLHWSDSESLLLFERLAEPDLGPILLVGTYRPDAVHRRHPVGELLPRLERRHSVTNLRLGRLTTLDVAAFVTAVYGRSPSFRVVEALHGRTGGNPFFLEEILTNAGDADIETLCDQPLPWSVADVVRGQLEDLDPSVRRIVEAAAVLGQRVSFDVLALVTRTSEDELIAVLRSLVSEGLLVEADPDVFSFRHALAREAVEGELLGRERRRLHRLALDALCEADSSDLAGIAHHAAGAGDAARLIEAARLGSQGYLRQGSSYQALQLAELGLGEAEDDEELLGVAARSAWLAGLLHDATEHNRQLLVVVRQRGDLEALSAALRLAMRLAWERGDFPEMVGVTDEVAALVDRLGPGGERGRAMALVAQANMLRDRTDDAVEWADRALAEAESTGDEGVRAAALVEKGSTLIVDAHRSEEGAELLAEAVELGERLGDDVVVARALHNLVRTDSRPRDPGVARVQLERMRAAAERVGYDSMAGAAHAQGLADLAEWDGDLDAAVAHLAEGRITDRGYLVTTKGSAYQVHEAGLALELGEIDRAALLTSSLRGTGGAKPTWYLGLEAHIAARRGDLVAARSAMAELIDLAADDWINPQPVHDIVAAALRAGITAAELRLLQATTRTSGLDGAAGGVLIEAQLAEAEGHHDDAYAGYTKAAIEAAGLFPSVRGTAHVGAARALIALGRADEAKEHVAAAEELLSRWRGWRVDELDAVRRRFGMGPAVAGPDALTRREREVVALLAEGLSNAEVAARLFISPKTAAVHVSNVLAKLEMSSRTEVAAWAIRDGLVG